MPRPNKRRRLAAKRKKEAKVSLIGDNLSAIYSGEQFERTTMRTNGKTLGNLKGITHAVRPPVNPDFTAKVDPMSRRGQAVWHKVETPEGVAYTPKTYEGKTVRYEGTKKRFSRD